MGRRSFTREFKLEAVRSVRDRGVSVAQASRDLGVHQNVLRNWGGTSRPTRGRPFPAKAS